MGLADLPAKVKSGTTDFCEETWTWDSPSKSPEVTLSNDYKAAYFHTDPVAGSKGTAGVRGTRGLSDGEHYWEVNFLEPAVGSSVMVGVGTHSATLHVDDYQYVNLIGKDAESWGLSYKGTVWHKGQSKSYCSPFFAANTVIGVHLNLYKGTLTFYKDGQSLGVAFSDIRCHSQELYPIISSTNTNTELELGLRFSRYLSLQQKCCYVVASCLKKGCKVDRLPLPKLLQSHVLEFH